LSCKLAQHREQIAAGLLTTGLRNDAFLAEWGSPDRTYTKEGKELLEAGFRFFFRGRPILDVWEYTERGVTLVFRGRGLLTWKTDKTVSELKRPAQKE
jgi:hypothetical protein